MVQVVKAEQAKLEAQLSESMAALGVIFQSKKPEEVVYSKETNVMLEKIRALGYNIQATAEYPFEGQTVVNVTISW